MDKIRFTYNGAEVNPSVILLLFFRFLGVYVYERLIDTPPVLLKQIENMAGEESRSIEPDRVTEFDAELFYAASFEDYSFISKQYRLNLHSGKAIILYLKGSVPKEMIDLNRECWIPYDEQKPELELFNDLINRMEEKELLSGNAAGQFRNLAGVYSNNRLWELSLTTKYFYAPDDEKTYKANKSRYEETINGLFEVLRENKASWGNSGSLYLQYAALNLIYESELYNQKCNQMHTYSAAELAVLCGKILRHNEELHCCRESFELLQAQIHDDLLGDINMAYEEYLSCCKGYNAYAYFRRGIYWQSFAHDFQYALKYYYGSVQIYPEYYRAWYRIGNCYMQMKKYKNALKAFDIVCAILKHRLEHQTIRPMEIEHMFKAENQAAFICNKILQNPSLSIARNMGALEAWDAIENSSFYELMDCSGKEIRTYKKILAEHLNIKKIWIELMKLGETVQDDNLVKYSMKILEETEY